mmetsp:Transcript_6549/g.21203  ORF Transcript_6549/g.21203 Transcript_6549/m.21203 type:complete len:307 (+) Transcript_6549:69-989(+)
MSVLLGCDVGSIRWDFPPCLTHSAFQQSVMQRLSGAHVTVAVQQPTTPTDSLTITICQQQQQQQHVPVTVDMSPQSHCATGHSLGYAAVVERVDDEGGRKRGRDELNQLPAPATLQLRLRWTTPDDVHDCSSVVGWLSLSQSVRRALTARVPLGAMPFSCVHVLASRHEGSNDEVVSSAVLEVLGELPADAAPDERALFVARLAPTTTADGLEIIFSRFGEVDRVSLVKDENGAPRGYGFVHFTTKADAEAAYVGMHEAVVDGKRIVVDFSQSHRGRHPPPRRPQHLHGGSDRRSAASATSRPAPR